MEIEVQYHILHVPSGKTFYGQVRIRERDVADLFADWNVHPDWLYSPVRFNSERLISHKQFMMRQGNSNHFVNVIVC